MGNIGLCPVRPARHSVRWSKSRRVPKPAGTQTTSLCSAKLKRTVFCIDVNGLAFPDFAFENVDDEWVDYSQPLNSIMVLGLALTKRRNQCSNPALFTTISRKIQV